MAPPSLADKLLHSEEDEDTSGTADTDPKQRQAALTISFLGRKVLLLVKSVEAGGVKEDGGGVAVDSPSIHRFIDHLINPSIHPSIHPSIDTLINPSIESSINPSIDQSIDQFIDPSIHPSINHSINQSIDRSIHLSINRSIHPSMH